MRRGRGRAVWMLPLAGAAMAAIGTATAQSAELPGVTLADLAGGDAMALAPRLIDPAVLPTVVDGAIGRPLPYPGPYYPVSYYTAPRVAEADLCRRTRYRTRVGRSLFPPAGKSLAEAPITRDPVERGDEVAVIAARGGATPASCTAAAHYVPVSADAGTAARQVAALRLIVGAAQAAAERRRLPFALDCAPQSDRACGNARRALATLPLGSLFDIYIAGPRAETTLTAGGRASIVTRLPPRADETCTVELSFGPEGDDNRSWRISWSQGRGAPTILHLRHINILYH